jgi:hypothetical protein
VKSAIAVVEAEICQTLIVAVGRYNQSAQAPFPTIDPELLKKKSCLISAQPNYRIHSSVHSWPHTNSTISPRTFTPPPGSQNPPSSLATPTSGQMQASGHKQ